MSILSDVACEVMIYFVDGFVLWLWNRSGTEMKYQDQALVCFNMLKYYLLVFNASFNSYIDFFKKNYQKKKKY